jgi:Ca-activated chloride channel homolog
MDFAVPLALGLSVLAVPVGYVALRRRRRGYAVATTSGVANIRPSLRLRLARWLPLLRIAAIVTLVIALAGPRVGDANAVVPGEGIDIALSLDISSSMNADFGSTTRLDATKAVIRDFIKGRENDRIGLVVFEQDALPLAPPTLDYDALDRVVADVKTGLLPDGTGIGVGLAAALNMLKDSTATTRIVILLTDGQHNAPSISPQDAAALAQTLGVRVYTIGVLDTGPISRASLDEALLRQIAEPTGGQYFSADNPQALARVYEEIGKLETSHVGRDHFERFTELAPWFAAGAAGLLLCELALSGLWLRRAPT